MSHTEPTETTAWIAYVFGLVVAFALAIIFGEDKLDAPDCYHPLPMRVSTAAGALTAKSLYGNSISDRDRLIFELGYWSAMGFEACSYVNERRPGAEEFRDLLNLEIDSLVARLGGAQTRYKGCNRPWLFASRVKDIIPTDMRQQLRYADKLVLFERFPSLLSADNLAQWVWYSNRHSIANYVPSGLVQLTDFHAVTLFVFGDIWNSPTAIADFRESCSSHTRSKAPRLLLVACMCVFAGSMLKAFAYIPRLLNVLVLPFIEMFLSGIRARAHKLLPCASFVSGAGLITILYVMYRTVVFGVVEDVDVAVVFGVSVMLGLSAQMALYCRRVSRRICDIDMLPAGRFVLFLRSFSSDGLSEASDTPTIGIQEWSEEEELVELFSNSGPFLAYHNPVQHIPHLGALKIRAPHDWWMYVREAMLRAHLIIIRMSHTNGLQWELSEIFRMNLHSRVLFVVPDASLSNAANERKSFLSKMFSGGIDQIVEAINLMCSVLFSSRDANNPRFRFLDENGEELVRYRHLSRWARWFSRFRRAVDTRRDLEMFARRHNVRLSYRRWSQDLLCDLVCTCLAAWIIWCQVDSAL